MTAAGPEVLLLAEQALAARDLDRAAGLFAEAYARGPAGAPAAGLGLARVALLLGRSAEALRLVDEVLARWPRDADALVLRALVAEDGNDLDAAQGWLSRALAAAPTHATAWFNQGRLHALRSRWEHAVASFTLSLQHGADAPESRVHLGTALFRQGRVADALKALTAAVQQHPDHLDATLTLADCLVATGQLDLADRLLAEASGRFPRAGVLASKRAVIAMQRDDLALARREAWRHTELCPADEEAWLFAAVVDTMQLRFDGAERALRAALRLNPAQWRAHHHLGCLFDALKDLPRARAAYRAAIALNPAAWEPLNNLATGLLEDGGLEALGEARALLERAAALLRGAEGVTARYNLLLACWRLDDRRAAEAVARELLGSAPPGHPLAEEARRLLRGAA